MPGASVLLQDLADIFTPSTRVGMCSFERDECRSDSVDNRGHLRTVVETFSTDKLPENVNNHLRDLSREAKLNVSGKLSGSAACYNSGVLERHGGVSVIKVTREEFKYTFRILDKPLVWKHLARSHKISKKWHRMFRKRKDVDWVAPNIETTKLGFAAWS